MPNAKNTLLQQLALLVLLAILCVSRQAQADVLIIAKSGLNGPAPMLAIEQIKNWDTLQPVKFLDHEPDNLPQDINLIIELTEDFDFRKEMPMANGATIRYSCIDADQSRIASVAQSACEAINQNIELPQYQFIVERTIATTFAKIPRIRLTTSSKNEDNLQRFSIRTRQFRQGVFAILSGAKIVSDKNISNKMVPAKTDKIAHVAYWDDAGGVSSTGHGPFWVRQTMRDQKDLDVYLICADDIRTGALNQFDVLIMGGGSSSTQAKCLGDEGKDAIRSFIRAGGGYVGACAGAYLGAGGTIGLGIAPVNTKPTGAAGTPIMQIATDITQLASLKAPENRSSFHGGPIMTLANDAEQFHAKIWATFTENIVEAKVTPLANTASVIGSTYGKGRVVLFGPHCERAPGPQSLFWTAIRWAGGRLEVNPQSSVKKDAH